MMSLILQAADNIFSTVVSLVKNRAVSCLQDLEIVAIHAIVLVGIGYLFGGS